MVEECSGGYVGCGRQAPERCGPRLERLRRFSARIRHVFVATLALMERPSFTVGIEEEYLIVDPETRDLVKDLPDRTHLRTQQATVQ